MSEQRLPFGDGAGDGPVDSRQLTVDSRAPRAPATNDYRLATNDSRDAEARLHSVDPSRNIVLEASAGTGKTRVLVERYVNLLRAGVDPRNILAITFTRKAAAEMRERIIDRLREASRLSSADLARWRDLREHLGDIAISTIDAFCLSLLREFPLEADVDPGFDIADQIEVPRLVDESLDQALRVCRVVAREDEEVALVFAQLGERRLRAGLGALLDRRLVAASTLRRFLERGPKDLTAAVACGRAAARLREALGGVRGGVRVFLADGPSRHPQFAMLADDISRLCTSGATGAVDSGFDTPTGQAAFRGLIDRLRAYFLTQDGKPREKAFSGTGFAAEHCDSNDAWKRHRRSAAEIAPLVAEAIRGFRRDLNVVMSRGVWRIFGITLAQYRRTLDTHALLDFPGVLERAVGLLKEMGEFAQSRFRLEARYRHVLVDEFQDTSPAQWALVSELVRSWGEGMGASADALAPSIFIVGDRKQSIYGFRDADVALVDEAASFIEGLRAEGDPRRAITVSFRAVPALLAFVNDVFDAIVADDSRSARGPREDSESAPAASVEMVRRSGQASGGGAPRGARKDRFRYDQRDRFPNDSEVRQKPDTTDAGTTDPGSVRFPPPHEGSASAEALADRRSLGGGCRPDLAEHARSVRLQPDETERGGSVRLQPDLGLIVGDTVTAAAERVAAEIVRLLAEPTVRDKTSGERRAAKPADIAILFRARDSHREFEKALKRLGVSTYVYKGLGFFEADEIQDAVALLRYLADPLSNLRAAAFLRSRIVRLSDAAVASLAKSGLGRALVDPEPPDVAAALGGDDAHVFARLRSALPRWLSWVDRMTPLALFSAILTETAYELEARGAGERQARENLKKLRGIVGRFQNRGYATLGRVADHLDELAVGDESNASIDASDSVSLMTVHAAKGLEFPIVFVVNMGRGTGGLRAPIRVAVDCAAEASVAIADYQSEADEDAQARDREETKRLLYVALSRARDRLYLSATVPGDVPRMGRGSLGEVLPASLKTLFATASAAGAGQSTIDWTGPGGRVHRIALCRVSAGL